jgi:hypothetical protein
MILLRWRAQKLLTDLFNDQGVKLHLLNTSAGLQHSQIGQSQPVRSTHHRVDTQIRTQYISGTSAGIFGANDVPTEIKYVAEEDTVQRSVVSTNHDNLQS